MGTDILKLKMLARPDGCGDLNTSERKIYVTRRIAPVNSPATSGENDELFLQINPPSPDERQRAIAEIGNTSFCGSLYKSAIAENINASMTSESREDNTAIPKALRLPPSIPVSSVYGFLEALFLFFISIPLFSIYANL